MFDLLCRWNIENMRRGDRDEANLSMMSRQSRFSSGSQESISSPCPFHLQEKHTGSNLERDAHWADEQSYEVEIM